MGALPQPSEWAKDPYSRLGDRFNRIEAAIESLKTARSIVATSAETEIANSDAFFVGTYGEAAFTDVYVPKGYSQCYILMAVDAGQTVTGGGGGNVGVQPRILPSTTGVYIRGIG